MYKHHYIIASTKVTLQMLSGDKLSTIVLPGVANSDIVELENFCTIIEISNVDLDPVEELTIEKKKNHF